MRGIRKQVNRLAMMGLDRMALLDVIVNPPSTAMNSNGWFEAAGRSQDSLRDMKQILEARLPAGTAAAQFVWSAGSVAGGDESIRGAGAPRMLRAGLPNPALAMNDAAVAENRRILVEGISSMLAKLPRPAFFPAIFAGCRACQEVRPFGNTVCSCTSQDGPN